MIENLALDSSQPRDVPAAVCIHIPGGEVCRGGVFIAFGGPQGHADRLSNPRPIGKSACREEATGTLTAALLWGAANRGYSRLSSLDTPVAAAREAPARDRPPLVGTRLSPALTRVESRRGAQESVA
jgi:hypothetical protein